MSGIVGGCDGNRIAAFGFKVGTDTVLEFELATDHFKGIDIGTGKSVGNVSGKVRIGHRQITHYNTGCVFSKRSGTDLNRANS